ncbi:MAG: GNAT family N-acetyltransferase [Chloroflexota bacterium]|nr:GNAT family N-acetyltransferase [Chloroflexota bacterium]
MSDETVLLIPRLPVERWSEYRDLRLRALETDPAAFGQTLTEARAYPDTRWQDRLREAHDGAAWIVFAEVDGRLAGMLGAFQTEDDRDRRNATIWGVFVDPAARGKRIAQAMLDQLLAQLREAGLLTATLSVNKEQTAAVRLYERAGFRIVGHETVTLGDGLPHDEYLMEALVGSRIDQPDFRG